MLIIDLFFIFIIFSPFFASLLCIPEKHGAARTTVIICGFTATILFSCEHYFYLGCHLIGLPGQVFFGIIMFCWIFQILGMVHLLST